jgi:hypothetical protein
VTGSEDASSIGSRESALRDRRWTRAWRSPTSPRRAPRRCSRRPRRDRWPHTFGTQVPEPGMSRPCTPSCQNPCCRRCCRSWRFPSGRLPSFAASGPGRFRGLSSADRSPARLFCVGAQDLRRFRGAGPPSTSAASTAVLHPQNASSTRSPWGEDSRSLQALLSESRQTTPGDIDTSTSFFSAVSIYERRASLH